MPSRSYRTRHTKSGPATCKARQSLLLSSTNIARVESMSTANFQCLLVLQKEGHNERLIATGRIEFSAQLVDSSITECLMKRVSFSQRFSV